MTIETLVTDPDRRTSAPEADALLEASALQGAALLYVRMDMVTSSVWLLFDAGAPG
jgi:hypothetical protein